MTDEPKKSEEKKGVLDKLLEGDNLSKIILVLVAITGGGNVVATKVEGDRLDRELDRAIQEVHELHGAFNDAMTRQKRLEAGIQAIKDKVAP